MVPSRILIIEDNGTLAALYCEALRAEGFEAEAALSGAAGVKAALRYAPDLILLDYELGDMSGYDVAIGIRCMRSTASTPFILLSSLAGDPLLMKGFTSMRNCKGTLIKNLPVAEIVDAVKRFCRPSS